MNDACGRVIYKIAAKTFNKGAFPVKKLPFTLFLLLALLLVACGGSNNAAEPMAENTAMSENDAMMNDTTMEDEAMNDEAMEDEAMHDETMEDEMMDEEAMSDEAMGDEMMSDAAAWQKITLTNVRTGETFTLGDFAGKTVFVEPMATWCTNCRQQLGNVRTARESLSNNNVAFVALSVETNVTAETLAQYAEDNDFGWTFAVATPELLAELVNTFGRTITNPPSTPHFIIRPDGTATALVTGIESSEQIISQITTEGNL